MHNTKLKSFTLSEMLVVLVITAIVVGMAFSVLSLVQKQIRNIESNFSRTTELSLLEQRLWQDFNRSNENSYRDNMITMLSGNDTVRYTFMEGFVLRNSDTIPAKLKIGKIFLAGNEITTGTIDAVSISATAELPDYLIFISSTPDATSKMNSDGL